MTLELFINFNGNCREAAEFYAKVFKSEVKNLMTVGESPQDPEHPMNPADKDKIMYASVMIGGSMVMFMDAGVDYPVTMGDNITPTLNIKSKEEVDRIFNELKEGGRVYMEPQKTFFSEWYAMVKDKFGVVWHVMYYTKA
jgi:PhnB protein